MSTQPFFQQTQQQQQHQQQQSPSPSQQQSPQQPQPQQQQPQQPTTGDIYNAVPSQIELFRSIKAFVAADIHQQVYISQPGFSYFAKSKIPLPITQQLIALSDADNDNILSPTEFVLCMVLHMRFRRCNVLPTISQVFQLRNILVRECLLNAQYFPSYTVNRLVAPYHLHPSAQVQQPQQQQQQQQQPLQQPQQLQPQQQPLQQPLQQPQQVMQPQQPQQQQQPGRQSMSLARPTGGSYTSQMSLQQPMQPLQQPLQPLQPLQQPVTGRRRGMSTAQNRPMTSSSAQLAQPQPQLAQPQLAQPQPQQLPQSQTLQQQSLDGTIVRTRGASFAVQPLQQPVNSQQSQQQQQHVGFQPNFSPIVPGSVTQPSPLVQPASAVQPSPIVQSTPAVQPSPTTPSNQQTAFDIFSSLYTSSPMDYASNDTGVHTQQPQKSQQSQQFDFMAQFDQPQLQQDNMSSAIDDNDDDDDDNTTTTTKNPTNPAISTNNNNKQQQGNFSPISQQQQQYNDDADLHIPVSLSLKTDNNHLSNTSNIQNSVKNGDDNGDDGDGVLFNTKKRTDDMISHNDGDALSQVDYISEEILEKREQLAIYKDSHIAATLTYNDTKHDEKGKEEELHKIMEEITNLKNLISQLEVQTEESQDQYNIYINDIETYTTERDTLQTSVDELTKKHEEKKQENEVIQEKIVELKDTILHLQERETKINEELISIDNLDQTVKELEIDLTVQQAKVDSNENQINDKKEYLITLEKHYNELKQKSEDLQISFDSSQKKLDELTSEIEQYQAKRRSQYRHYKNILYQIDNVQKILHDKKNFQTYEIQNDDNGIATTIPSNASIDVAERCLALIYNVLGHKNPLPIDENDDTFHATATTTNNLQTLHIGSLTDQTSDVGRVMTTTTTPQQYDIILLQEHQQQQQHQQQQLQQQNINNNNNLIFSSHYDKNDNHHHGGHDYNDGTRQHRHTEIESSSNTNIRNSLPPLSTLPSLPRVQIAMSEGGNVHTAQGFEINDISNSMFESNELTTNTLVSSPSSVSLQHTSDVGTKQHQYHHTQQQQRSADDDDAATAVAANANAVIAPGVSTELYMNKQGEEHMEKQDTSDFTIDNNDHEKVEPVADAGASTDKHTDGTANDSIANDNNGTTTAAAVEVAHQPELIIEDDAFDVFNTMDEFNGYQQGDEQNDVINENGKNTTGFDANFETDFDASFEPDFEPNFNDNIDIIQPQQSSESQQQQQSTTEPINVVATEQHVDDTFDVDFNDMFDMDMSGADGIATGAVDGNSSNTVDNEQVVELDNYLGQEQQDKNENDDDVIDNNNNTFDNQDSNDVEGDTDETSVKTQVEEEEEPVVVTGVEQNTIVETKTTLEQSLDTEGEGVEHEEIIENVSENDKNEDANTENEKNTENVDSDDENQNATEEEAKNEENEEKPQEIEKVTLNQDDENAFDFGNFDDDNGDDNNDSGCNIDDSSDSEENTVDIQDNKDENKNVVKPDENQQDPSFDDFNAAFDDMFA